MEKKKSKECTQQNQSIMVDDPVTLYKKIDLLPNLKKI
jgi:hypothetical protein